MLRAEVRSSNLRRVFHLGVGCLTALTIAAACGSSDDTSNEAGGTSNSGAAAGAAGSSAHGGKANAGAGGASATGGASAAGGSANGGSTAGGGEAGAVGQGGQAECAKDVQAAKLTPANLLFLIDKSGSMNCNPPEGDAALNARCADFPIKEDPNQPSKWEVASDALAGALATLAEQPNTRAGLTLFPVADQCGVSADPAVEIDKLSAAHARVISDALGDVSPSGDTPLAGATILSFLHLSEMIRNHELVGNTFIVLLTDGAETCKVSELEKLLETDVPNARLFNIRTFVIGAPGSEEARALLSQMAFEGGTASSADCDHGGDQPDEGDCHFDMTKSKDFAKDLDAALQAISRTKVLSCEYDVPTNPDGGGVDLRNVNVSYQPGTGGRAEDVKQDDAPCDEANGWRYSDDHTKIMLCGSICDRVQADPAGTVSIVLGCPTIKVK